MFSTFRSTTVSLAAAILFLGVASGASASPLIDVQFTPNGSPSYSGAAVLGSAGNSWNTFRGGNSGGASGSGLSLKDATGASTGITLSYTTPNGFFDATNFGATFMGTPYAALLDAYLYADKFGAGAGTVTLSGLTAGADYQLILYSVSNTPGTVTHFTVGGTTQSVDQTSTTTLTAGANYTDFTAVADASGHLTISFTGGGGVEGDLNGLQLQELTIPTPEPASLTLLAMGLAGLGMVLRMRRA
jgi:hypothetical protein